VNTRINCGNNASTSCKNLNIGPVTLEFKRKKLKSLQQLGNKLEKNWHFKLNISEHAGPIFARFSLCRQIDGVTKLTFILWLHTQVTVKSQRACCHCSLSQQLQWVGLTWANQHQSWQVSDRQTDRQYVVVVSLWQLKSRLFLTCVSTCGKMPMNHAKAWSHHDPLFTARCYPINSVVYATVICLSIRPTHKSTRRKHTVKQFFTEW